MSHRNRMAIAVLSLVGLFVSIYLMLHRLGVIGTLACGIDGGCATVQSSSYATFLGVPVPLLGIVGYGVLFGVSMVGTSGASRSGRGTAIALLALATGGFAFSIYLTALEAFVIHAWCRWCVVSAVLATLIFLFSIPEVARLRGEPAP